MNVPVGMSVELLGNMIIKKVFTRPTRIYDLGNISFWPDESLRVCHGGALF